MKTVQLGDTQWCYEEKGNGPAIVFIHGFPMDHRIWLDQLDGLSSTYRVIAVDLKGFGNSRSTQAFTIDSMADDLAQFIGAVNAAPCVLVGLSMGGYISFSLAARHPEVLRALIIVSSKAEADTPQAREGRQKMAELAQKAGANPVAEQMLPRVLSEQTMASRNDLVEKMRQIMEACPANSIANASFAMRDRADRTPDLPGLQMPVLIMLGEKDHLIPLDAGQKMAEACPKGRFVAVPNAGHMAPMESPAAVNAGIKQFISTLGT
jgi:pimeloyl-ACP methyl ester carboxylesterase